MNIIDLIIILIGGAMIYRWYKVGLVRNLFAVGGLFVGIVIGLFIAPGVMSLFKDSVGKFAGAILTIALTTLAFGTLGEAMGMKLNIRLQSKNAQKINSVAGSFGGVIFLLLFVWLASAIIISSPFKTFNSQLENSAIIQFLNRRLPPTPPIIDRVNALVEPLDFPQVFSGVPQKLSEPVAPAGSVAVQEAVQNAGKSTVKIEARGCGNAISNGSGFIVGDGLVMTNAHVIAGATEISVIDTTGTYISVPVYFDPTVDIAILKTPKLSAKSLNISTKQFSRGQEAVVLGFPGGGNFRAEPAGITNTIFARGLDIYGQTQVNRDVYEFIGNVVQGNSGGPLVLSDGTVIGMVFASSQNNQGYGYALTGEEISRALKLINQSGVSTQACYQ